MSTATNPTKVVNANNNYYGSWYMDYPEYTPYILLANWLIEKHCTQWWKNHPETMDYRLSQFSICMELSGTFRTKESKLGFIAIDLQCHPLVLLNDPSPELKNIK